MNKLVKWLFPATIHCLACCMMIVVAFNYKNVTEIQLLVIILLFTQSISTHLLMKD